MVELSNIEDVEEGKTEGNGRRKDLLPGTSFQTSDTGDSASDAPTRVMGNVDPNLIPVEHDEDDPDDEERRKSQLCCGSCCDFVRACLVVNSIYISFLVFFNVGIWFFPEIFQKTGGERIRFTASEDESDIQLGGFDDDLYVGDETRKCYFCTTTIQNVVGMVFALIGAIGAWRFQKHMVLTAGIWYCIDAIAFFVLQNYAAGLWILVYSYPHFGLFLALRSGKITPENYATTEKHCCGCDRDED